MMPSRLSCSLLLVFAAQAFAAEPAGWKIHQGRPGMPAVLLIHGLAASKGHWVDPGSTWSIKSAHFKHWKKPKAHSGDMVAPTVKDAIESLVLSPNNKKVHGDDSFWNALVEAGFTVATWNQIPCMDTSSTPDSACLDSDTFDVAYPSAKVALAELARVTDPATPIALIGHSRGGLIGRRLLKEKDLPGVDRVRWYISLHTPHGGSSMATRGKELKSKLKAIDSLEDALDLDFLPKAARGAMKKLLPNVGSGLTNTVDALVTVTGMKGAEELAKDGKIYKALTDGEKKLPKVAYFTFGGTSPRVARIHARVYEGSITGKWKASPRAVFDFPVSLKVPFDEMKKGGDLLVTDESSHFGFEDHHYKNALNHAEVLWDHDVQADVVKLLKSPGAAIDSQSKELGEEDADDEDDAAAPAAIP